MNMNDIRKDIEFKKFKNRIVPSRETHTQGTSGSMHTSRHSALLDVADHSRCRTRLAVPSLERPPGRRQSEEEEDDAHNEDKDDPRKLASSCGDALQKLDRSHTRAGVADADGDFRGLLSQLSVRAEDWNDDTREQLNRRMMVLDVVSRSCG
jgi:hypothetical protein